jgi:hypothetical protein
MQILGTQIQMTHNVGVPRCISVFWLCHVLLCIEYHLVYYDTKL